MKTDMFTYYVTVGCNVLLLWWLSNFISYKHAKSTMCDPGIINIPIPGAFNALMLHLLWSFVKGKEDIVDQLNFFGKISLSNRTTKTEEVLWKNYYNTSACLTWCELARIWNTPKANS